jgi:hypothetical protein
LDVEVFEVDVMEIHDALNNETAAPVPAGTCVTLSNTSTYSGPAVSVNVTWTGVFLKETIRPTLRSLNAPLTAAFKAKAGYIASPGSGQPPQTTSGATWLYYATQSGAMAMWPAAASTTKKTFDPTVRPWFARSASTPNDVIISSPYFDFGGAGFVVTFSKAARTSAGLPSLPARLHGVAGADFSSSEINSAVKGKFAAALGKMPGGSLAVHNGCGSSYNCLQSPTGRCETRCYVVDSGGYVVYAHDSHRATTLRAYEPVGHIEGGLVSALVASRVMINSTFTDVSSGCVVPCSGGGAAPGTPETEESSASRVSPASLGIPGWTPFVSGPVVDTSDTSSSDTSQSQSRVLRDTPRAETESIPAGRRSFVGNSHARRQQQAAPTPECRTDCTKFVSVLRFNDAAFASSASGVSAALQGAGASEAAVDLVRAYFDTSGGGYPILERTFRTSCSLGTAYVGRIQGTNTYSIVLSDYWAEPSGTFSGQNGKSEACPETVPTAVRARDECGIRTARPSGQPGCIAPPSNQPCQKTCEDDCSRQGDCSNGQCLCDVGFFGATCADPASSPRPLLFLTLIAAFAVSLAAMQ